MSSTMDQVHIQPSHYHSTPSNQAFSQTQLHFNLNPVKNVVQNQVGKPRPIVIEKLLPHPKSRVEAASSSNLAPHPTEEIFPSDRLAMAMQLAKMDIKRLKSMLDPNEKGVQLKDVLQNSLQAQPKKSTDDRKKPFKDHVKSEKTEKPKQKYVIHVYPDEMAKNEKFRRSKDDKVGNSFVDADPSSKDKQEINRLHRDLLNHTTKLDHVVQRLGQQKYPNPSKETDGNMIKEQERKRIRAEEQKIRSARILYMLQHKVHNVEKELNKQKNVVKPTKKSQYQNSLASAHRAAVRALQVFVNNAPLHFDATGILPSTYKQLGLLIQQLTLLSNEISSGDKRKDSHSLDIIEDLITSLNVATGDKTTKKIKGGDTKATKNISWQNQKSKQEYLDRNIDWLRKKADDLNLKSFQNEDNATPERLSTLEHAIKVIGDSHPQPSKKTVKKSPERLRKKPRVSLLLPYGLKKKRLIHVNHAYHPQPSSNQNFAAPTVISRIREKPQIERKSKSSSTSKKNVGSTPKQRNESIIDEAKFINSPPQSPNFSRNVPHGADTSPSYQPKFSPQYYNGHVSPSSPMSSLASSNYRPPYSFMEKEIRRQNWLDRLHAYQAQKLTQIGKMNVKEIQKMRKQYHTSHDLLITAEEEIKNKLKPLLEKAEMIAEEEAKREEEYKTSVKKRLGDVASQKALSEGERLAEYIMEDLMMEAAIEFQQIETDNQNTIDAAYNMDRPTLEQIIERLDTFEMEEEKIRRNWQSLQYSNGSETTKSDRGLTDDLQAKPFIFTSLSSNKKSERLPDIPLEESLVHTTTLDIPAGMADAINMCKEKYEAWLTEHTSNNVDAFSAVEELSEEILTELLEDVANEVNEHCNQFVDDIYEKEFLHNKSR